PVHTSRADPRVDPWDRHAQPRPAAGATPAYVGLRGAAVFGFAVDPADDTFLVAATTRGLHHIGPGPAADRWVQFSLAAWTGFVITDVAWTPSTAGHPSLLWVAVVNTTATSPAGTSVWVSSAGMSGPLLQVALPGAVVNGRLAFGADPAFPDVVYVLGSGPRLWRLNVVTPFPAAPAAPAVATAVTQLPSLLYGANNQSQYDM